MSYFAPKSWSYFMIWLPRTTDNSTHFAQSLEILKKRFYFPPFYSCFFFLFQFPMSIDSLDQFILQFINVLATNNDLLMDLLNVSYFAPKSWPYFMIWLPRTTDNSTHFAQSLEIRGIESRLYL